VLCLDSVLALTRGNPSGPAAVLPYLGLSSFTGVAPGSDGEPDLIGQMIYTVGERSAHVSFIAPKSQDDSPRLLDLLEVLACQAGEWGAFNLLAEVEEHHAIIENLRRTGFCVFAWQRIWRFHPEFEGQNTQVQTNATRFWRSAKPLDEIAIRSLYQSLVPPLVQSAEPLPAHAPRGLVYRKDGEVLAYVESKRGPKGVYLHPLLHPGIENVVELLRELIWALPMPVLDRPICICVRSYQSWLESALEEMSGEVAPRQVLFVKHLVNLQRVPAVSRRLTVIEKQQTEPTSPMVNSYRKTKN
jgi:hypothetical protein